MKSESPERWTDARLGRHADLLVGFAFKSAEFADGPDGVRLLRGDNVGHGRLRWNGARKWPLDRASEFERYEVQPGDIVMAMDRPWIDAGLKYATVRDEDVPCLLVQRVARLRGTASLCQRYLAYVIGSPAFTRYVQAVQTGTAVPHISGGQIAEFRFPLPPRGEQERIAAVLAALDDKIDSNRRLAGVLEETAATLFRARFVDFVGVEEFEESEIGRIPRGWRVVSLSDVTQPTVGGVWGADAPSPKTPIPVRCLRGIDVHALASGDTPEPPLRYVSKAQLEKRRLLPGDILVEGSGSFCGRSGLFSLEWQDLYREGLVYSNFCKRIRPDVELGHATLAYLHLRSAYASGQTARFRTGSAFPNLDLATLCRAIKFALPPSSETEALVSLHGLASTTRLRIEACSLSAIRDALLPKLISGQMRVPDTADPAEVIEPAAEVLQATATQ